MAKRECSCVSSIDDLINQSSNKVELVDRASVSTKAVLVYIGDEPGTWSFRVHNMTSGDLAYAIMMLHREMHTTFDNDGFDTDD